MQQELIVYVDKRGIPTGRTAPKLDAHHANTALHLAFSCYVFNEDGKFLVTKRAAAKKVWPGVWTNSVCGHPLPKESFEDAIQRRLKDELGMKAERITGLVADYSYKTPPYNGIIEHEFCPVFAAKASSLPNPNPQEVADYEWVEWQTYIKRAESDAANAWSWWCKDQLRFLKNNPALTTFRSGLLNH